MTARNKPLKGAKTKVDPIRSKEAIANIKRMLGGKPRDHLLFVLGINNGIRTGDLLKLKAGDLMGKKPGDSITIRESKTGKENVVVVNKCVAKTLKRYMEVERPAPTDYLFRSRKGQNKPLSVPAASNLIKGWCRSVGLTGNFGAHTLRKTWGYCQRVYHGVGFEIICDRYKHSSPKVTMTYLGIESKEVHAALMNEI